MNPSGLNITEKFVTSGQRVGGGAFPMILAYTSARGPVGLTGPLNTLADFTNFFGTEQPSGNYVQDAISLYTLQSDNNAKAAAFYFVRVATALTQSAVATFTDATATPVNLMQFKATPGIAGALLRVTLLAATSGAVDRVNVLVERLAALAGATVQSELFENVYNSPTQRQSGKFVESVVNAGSKLVSVTVLADGLAVLAAKALVFVDTSYLVDPVPVEADWKAAIDSAIKLIKGPASVYVPDAYTMSIGSALVLDLAALVKLNGKLLVVDAVDGDTFTTVQTKMNTLTGNGAVQHFLRWGYGTLRPSLPIPLTAAWLGRYSARASDMNRGYHYPASSLPLDGILGLRAFSGVDLTVARTNNINIFLELDAGGFGLHGLWTADKDSEAFRQVSRYLIWKDIQFQIRSALQGIIQNNPINEETVKLINKRALAILNREAGRGTLVARGAKPASRGNGYDWQPNLTDQVSLNQGILSATLTLRDAATLEELSVVMSNYNDIA